MARAGHCEECGKNVWLTPEGTCPNGHPASSITGAYEASAPPPPPGAASSPPVAPAASAPSGAVAPVPAKKRGKLLIVVLVVLGLVLCGTLATCAVLVPMASKVEKVDGTDAGGGETPAPSAPAVERKGPKTAEELAQYLKDNHGSEAWYASIAEVRSATRLGYPVCVIVMADGGDRSFDMEHKNDRAIIDAVEAAEIAFANNVATIGVKGTRVSTSEEPWAGLSSPKPLAELDRPADLAALKSWIEAQWGPSGVNPVDEGWYEVFKTAQWSVEGDKITVKTSLKSTPDGGLAEEDLMYAVGAAKPTFAKWLTIVYADGKSDMDGTEYDIPWK